MHAVRNGLWCVFIVGGYLLIALVIIYNGPPAVYCVTIGVGLVLYALKLRDVNDMRLSELNIWTILYYFIMYVIIVAAAIGVGAAVNAAFVYIDPVYFRKLFPTDAYFDVIARRGIIIGSLHSIAFYIELQSHSGLDSTQFTSKVRLLEVVIVVIAAAGVIFVPYTVTLFIMIIAVTTAPDRARILWAGFMKSVFNKDVNLERQKFYKNNGDDGYRENHGYQHLVFIGSLVVMMPIKVTIAIHIPAAIFLVGFEAVTEPLRSLPSGFR